MKARHSLAIALMMCATLLSPCARAEDKKPDPKPKEIDKATVAAWEKQSFKAGWIAVGGISKERPAGITGVGMDYYEPDYFTKNDLPFPAGAIVGFQGHTNSGWRYVPRVQVPFGLSLERTEGKILEHLPALGNLTHLAVWPSNITNADLEPLAELNTLTHLSISSTHITGVGLKHLAGLKNLTSLTLTGREYSEYWLKYIGGLDNLTSLTWGGSNVITDEGLKQLAGLKRLNHLLLPGMHRVTDEGLSHLGGFAQLTRLDLSGAKVTNSGLKHLTGMTGLQNLDLRSTAVTDNGLAELAKLKNLRDLDLRDTKVTADGVKRLQEALPKCKITKQPARDAP